MQKGFGQSNHPILRKHLKCVKNTQMVIFCNLFDIFYGTRGLIDLIPFALSQATSGTSFQMAYFGKSLKLLFLATHATHEVIFFLLKPIYSQNVLP